MKLPKRGNKARKQQPAAEKEGAGAAAASSSHGVAQRTRSHTASGGAPQAAPARAGKRKLELAASDGKRKRAAGSGSHAAAVREGPEAEVGGAQVAGDNAAASPEQSRGKEAGGSGSLPATVVEEGRLYMLYKCGATPRARPLVPVLIA